MLFCASWASSFPAQDVPLSWQCLPKTLSLFANLACSQNGTTYVESRTNQPIGLLLDNEAITSASFSPWSFRPVCTAVLPRIGSKLCVYTSTDFGRGRGVSIFTTPRVAQEVVSLLPFRDLTVLDGISHGANLQYTQRMPSKGRGALAGSDLKRGELISSNVPLVIGYTEYEISHAEREEFLRVAVSQLPIASQKLFSNLTANFGGANLILSGIVETNAGFSMRLGGHEHYTLIPEISFLNHHCAPKYDCALCVKCHC
jgi:hypothetical protein